MDVRFLSTVIDTAVQGGPPAFLKQTEDSNAKAVPLPVVCIHRIAGGNGHGIKTGNRVPAAQMAAEGAERLTAPPGLVREANQR